MSDQNTNKCNNCLPSVTVGHHSLNTSAAGYKPWEIPIERYLTIKIKYLAEEITPLSHIEGQKSDWIDLRTAKEIVMVKGEFKLIPLGIAVELPKGYEALVIPRSSTYKKFGIMQANSMGVIDEFFCGDDDEWHFPALSTQYVKIPKNTRICQFRIIEHQPRVFLQTVKHLGNNNRGGFGSTGHE